MPYFFCRLCRRQAGCSSAHDAAAADVEVFLDHDHGGAGIAGCARARARDPGTDHHHIRCPIPFDVGSLGLLRMQTGGRRRARPAVPFATVVLRKLLRLTGFGPFRWLLMAFSLMVMTSRAARAVSRFCTNTIIFAVSGTNS